MQEPNVYGEIHRWPAERSQKKAGEIYETLLRIFAIAREQRIPTYRAADRLAEQRIAAVSGLALSPWRFISCTLDPMAEVIPIGSDHAGFPLKERLVAELRALGYEPLDLGTDSAESVDYPDYAHKVAARVENQEARRGVLLCGTGLGMSYAANRHAGVRAAVAWSPDVARLSREHNDANVLILPARFVSEPEGVEILRTWLETEFAGGRHSRRVAKIDQEHDG
jgi:ribose 5-phosphate isomerase B